MYALHRAAAAGIAARAGPLLRRAAVAQWEVRLRVASGGAWRIVASLPTGEIAMKRLQLAAVQLVKHTCGLPVPNV